MRLLFIATLLLAAHAASAEELKYDDGTAEESRSVAAVGHAVWFQEEFEAKSVRLHAARGTCRMFEVAAVDGRGNVLAQGAWDGRVLPEKPAWVRLAFPVEAGDGVMIVVYFNEGESASLSFDKNAESHSTWYYGGRHQPVEGGNWMVRLSSEPGEPQLSWAAATLPEGDTLRADRGKPFALWRSQAAHAVRFERPEGTALAGLELYAARTGRLTRPLTVTLCDDALRTLYRASFPSGVIPENEGWTSLPFPSLPASLPRSVWALVDFHDSPADFVEVGVCRNPEAACAEASPDGLFRRFPGGHAWMMRARLVKAEDRPAPAPPAADPADAAIVGEVARKLFKALEKLDRERLLGVLAPEAPGFDYLRIPGDDSLLDGQPHRRFTRELARRLEGERAVLVFATLQGPLLWDLPDAIRRRLPPNRPMPPGPALFTTDGPGSHSRPTLCVVRLSKSAGTWALLGWDEIDARDADGERGLLAGVDAASAFKGLAEARVKSLGGLEEEIAGVEDAGRRSALQVDLARQWAEAGEFERSEATAKELPEEARAALAARTWVHGRRVSAAGPPGANLRALTETADALLDGLQARFDLSPDGRLRLLVIPHEQAGFGAHPDAWSYPEVVWFVPEEKMAGVPDAQGLARALADAVVRLRDDAEQTRRWLAAGMCAEASLAVQETPASLAEGLKGIEPARNTVEGCLGIVVQASRTWGDAALGRALGDAWHRAALRETPSGPGMSLDDVAAALGRETKADKEVRALFERGRD